MHKSGDSKSKIVIGLVVMLGVVIFSFNDNFTGKVLSNNLPDLSIAELGINLISDTDEQLSFFDNEINALVCNNGKTTVSDFSVRIVIDNHNFDISNNEALASKECSYVHTFFKPFIENRRYITVSAIADHFRGIKEANENNNRLDKILNLTSYGPNLIISNIELVKGSNSGDDVFRIRFCNSASKVSVNKYVEIGISVNSYSRQIPFRESLGPNKCSNIYSPKINEFNINSKELNVDVLLDKTNVVVESNENDNSLSRKFIID